MKLGTLKDANNYDGQLIVVSQDNTKYALATDIVPSLREAVEKWAHYKPSLEARYNDLNDGKVEGKEIVNENLHSPLPRTFQWADGSAFIQHVKLVRKARGAEVPQSLYEIPLMYQGGSDNFLGPYDNIPQVSFEHGTDFEGEVGVITDYVPMGTSPEKALEKILLIVIINDVSLRGLIPQELAQGFGFLVSKPSSAFAPFAVTPEELGSAWKEGRVHLPLNVEYNGEFFGKANGSEMYFHFGQLIAHAAQTRNLMPGTIIGSGTVSNEDASVGSSCLAEKRMLEKINEGEIKTPFMKSGDTIKMEMLNEQGQNIFGTSEQKVVKAENSTTVFAYS